MTRVHVIDDVIASIASESSVFLFTKIAYKQWHRQKIFQGEGQRKRQYRKISPLNPGGGARSPAADCHPYRCKIDPTVISLNYKSFKIVFSDSNKPLSLPLY